MKNKNICIITARGGSKRIPRKNIKPFLGKPIIAYSIEAALSSNLFNMVMVSTDDEEIAEIGVNYGAKVPFLRSKKNSDDFSSTVDVLLEVIECLEKKNLKFEFGCCLYPTAPFITVEKLKHGHDLLTSGSFDAVLPVCSFSYPILRSLQMDSNGMLKMNWPENINLRSQDLPKSFHDAGQFYWFNVNKLIKNKTILGANPGGFEIDETEVQDIDSEVDWRLAELKYSFMKNKTKID